jgi:hypothetical protein
VIRRNDSRQIPDDGDGLKNRIDVFRAGARTERQDHRCSTQQA